MLHRSLLLLLLYAVRHIIVFSDLTKRRKQTCTGLHISQKKTGLSNVKKAQGCDAT